MVDGEQQIVEEGGNLFLLIIEDEAWGIPLSGGVKPKLGSSNIFVIAEESPSFFLLFRSMVTWESVLCFCPHGSCK